MSRIRGGSGLPDSGSDRESSTPLTRKPKHRGSYMGGSGDELDDVGYTDSDGGGSGGVATMRTERRATTTATSRKRISMVNEEGGGGGDPTMPPAPGAVGNLAGAPLGQRHHESMEHLAMQSSVTKNRSKFESSYSGSALALNAAAALGASPLTPKRGSEEDDPSNPSSPVARSTFSLSPSSNTPSGPSSNSSPTRIVPSASMSSVATPSRVGKSTAADLFGFGAASKRKPSTITASGDDPMSPQKFSIGGNGGGNTSAASSPAGGHVPEGGERAGTNGGLASAIGSGGSTATLSTHPALNISGGVGMRKGGRKASTMSLTSPSNDPDKSPRKGSKMKDSTMDFFRNEGLEEAVFPSSIDLGSLFGTKNNPQAAFDKMVQAARCYESVKPQWLKQQSSNSDHSPTRKPFLLSFTFLTCL
ncbi:hypothetical protein BC829DRAFT_275321 [Chytridium lagenaria]|nr:hypothetical protein BC829DRAFT_275321 [Chytridium lagenaria]